MKMNAVCPVLAACLLVTPFGQYTGMILGGTCSVQLHVEFQTIILSYAEILAHNDARSQRETLKHHASCLGGLGPNSLKRSTQG